MKSKTFIAGAVLALVAMAGVGSTAAYAQVYTTTSATASIQSSCLPFANNFGYGAYDYSTGSAVSALQNFLLNQGYFSSAYLGTGHYGSITAQSVARFQAAHGVSATGFVGPLTRALIQQISCGSNPTPIPTPTPVSGVSLYNTNPNAGQVGTTVTLTGAGFTSTGNTILMDGNVAASNVSASTLVLPIVCNAFAANCGSTTQQQSLTFTIPTALAPYCAPGFACPQYMRLLTPGQYTITVMNANGTSNALSFTVTSGTTNNQQLSISGLSAPASLALGSTGTWTVSVLSNGQGNLHYSVVWGDEAQYTNGFAAPQNTTVQSSATFTHAYQRAGNYTPVFTVTDDFGHTVSTSNTVVVTPLY